MWLQCYIGNVVGSYKVKGDDNVSPKIGQKLTDNPKDTTVRARMDKDTLAKLDCLVSEQKSDRSKIIRQGIEIQYNKRNEKE